MKIKTFFKHIGTGFKNVFRNGLMSFAAVSAVSITLLLLGALTGLLLNVNKFATDVQKDVSIRVYIDQTADQKEQGYLKESIEDLDHVNDVQFSSRDEQLENVISNYGEAFDMLDEDSNPLFDVFVVQADSPDLTASVAEEIEKLDHVTKVNYGGAKADRIFQITSGVRNVGIIIILALIFTAVFLISNTIRMTIFSRGREIEIMKLVGASNWYIRWPFIIEGAIVGILGAIIPVIAVSALYLTIYRRATDFLSGTYYELLPPNPYLYYLLALLVGIGIIIGSIGSAFSMRRFLEI